MLAKLVSISKEICIELIAQGYELPDDLVEWVVTKAVEVEPLKRNIHGEPIPEGEASRGNKVSAKTLHDEMERWRNDPVLAPHAPSEEEENDIIDRLFGNKFTKSFPERVRALRNIYKAVDVLISMGMSEDTALEITTNFHDPIQLSVHKSMDDTAIICFDVVDNPFSGMMQEPDAHITLVHLGDIADLDKTAISDKLAAFASNHAPVSGKFGGFAVFPKSDDNDDKAPMVALYDSAVLPAFRQALLHLYPLISDQNHGFTAHMTIGYTDKDVVSIPTDVVQPEVTFNNVSLWWGDEHISFPLVGHLVEKEVGDDIQPLVDARLALFDATVDGLAEQVYTGSISIGSWQESMKVAIKEIHTAMAAIFKGDWGLMTQSDWGKVGAEVKKQYRYLQGFAEDIATDADSTSVEYIKARAHMYGEAAVATGELMLDKELRDKLPWMPKDGTTECLVNCRCHWALTMMNISANAQTVKAIWVVDRAAESCKTCISRDGHSVVLRLSSDTYVPNHIP